MAMKGALEDLAADFFRHILGRSAHLICIGIINAVVWYARLHIKVIQPAVAS